MTRLFGTMLRTRSLAEIMILRQLQRANVRKKRVLLGRRFRDNLLVPPSRDNKLFENGPSLRLREVRRASKRSKMSSRT